LSILLKRQKYINFEHKIIVINYWLVYNDIFYFYQVIVTNIIYYATSKNCFNMKFVIIAITLISRSVNSVALGVAQGMLYIGRLRYMRNFLRGDKNAKWNLAVLLMLLVYCSILYIKHVSLPFSYDHRSRRSSMVVVVIDNCINKSETRKCLRKTVFALSLHRCCPISVMWRRQTLFTDGIGKFNITFCSKTI